MILWVQWGQGVCLEAQQSQEGPSGGRRGSLGTYVEEIPWLMVGLEGFLMIHKAHIYVCK